MTVVVLFLAVAVGVLGLLVFGLLRTHAEILRALDRAGISLDDSSSPPAGAAARSPGHAAEAEPEASEPEASDVESSDVEAARDIVGTVPQAGPTKVAVTGVPHLTLLAFLSSGCRSCKRFWEAFARPDLELPGRDTRLVVVGQDPAHDSESALAGLVPDGVKAVLSSAAWEDYDVPGSPYFALVDGAAARVVGAGSALEWDQLKELLEQALRDAGLNDRPGASRQPSARRSPGGRHRRIDEALLSAGIGPGHPSLYPPGSDINGERDGAGSNGEIPNGETLGGGTSSDVGIGPGHLGDSAQAAADR